jgi:hypothetical protein
MRNEAAHLRRQLAACEKALERSRDLARRRQESMEQQYQRAEDNKRLANQNASRAETLYGAVESAAEDLEKHGRTMAVLTRERDDARAMFWDLVQRMRANK